MAWHTELAAAPTKGEYVEGAHCVHAVAPSALAHVPAMHDAHCDVPLLGAADPGAQGTQRPDVAFANAPGAQTAHAGGRLPTTGTLPGVHVHEEEPVDTASVFAPHGKHDEDHPVAGAKVPAGQAAG